MNIDLSGDLRKSLNDALVRARRHYEGGEDEKAAQAYEAASRVVLKLAEYAPDRATEVKYKKDAIRYRDCARRLLAGEAPAPEPGDPASSQSQQIVDSRGSSTSRGPQNQQNVDSRAGRTAAAGGGGRGDGAGAVARRARAAGPAADGDVGELSSVVSQLVHASPVTWADIGGLEETKREIKYALGLAMARPPDGVQITTWRNMLFYGPPGTGKTLLAAATSNALRLRAQTTGDEQRAVFFNVKVSSVMSKYFGESTKIVSELYGQARDSSPAVVFLDEFEALASQRDKDDSGAERRILSTLLAELDGLSEKGRRDIFVLTVAATNRPWDLDPAVLSRFDKKVLIPLPDQETRRAILEIQIARKGYESEVPFAELAGMTEGYSGREIERFCKEVAHRMIAEMNQDLPARVDQGLEVVRGYQVRVRPLGRAEFESAKARIHPQTTPQEMARYVNWRESQVL